MDDTVTPLWARILIAVHLLIGGAVLGAVFGSGLGGALTGLMVATPVAMLAMFAPGVLLGLCVILELFRCAG